MEKIRLRDDLSWKEKQNAIETSLIMGFYSISAEFPIASRLEGIEIPKKLETLGETYKPITNEWPKDYVSSSKSAKPILEFDWRNKKGLETMFSKGVFLKDENFDQLPDKLNFKIIIPKDCNLSILIAACNFAFRYGMETTAFEGPIIADEGWQGNLLLFEEDHECGMKFLEKDERTVIRVHGQGKELESFSSHICESFPLLPEERTWKDQLQDMIDSFAMKNLDGELSYLKAYKEELEGSISAYLNPEIEERLDEVESLFPDVEFRNHKSLNKIYEKSYDIPWEVDVFKDILVEKLYNKLKPEDKVEIYAGLSEDMDVRKNLIDEIEDELKKIEIKSHKVEIISAYKQGFSWIEEVILPQLKDPAIKENINGVEIAFKAFLPKGEEEWIDEDGATPSYDNVAGEDSNKWLDIPIRYLQELYPIDDMIARELEIPRNMIKFLVYEGEEDITYKVNILDKDDKNILESDYKASYSERSYLDEYEGMGKVHPSTGFIRVYVNGREIVNEYIKTDLENIWDIYQEQVLPECKNFIELKTKGNPNKDDQPFFSQLKLEVKASEADYNLPFREDMISSLNAFHQDLYFVGMDYFKNYGLEINNTILDAPGLILPLVKKNLGKPIFKVTLYDKLEETPIIKADNKVVVSEYKRENIELYLEMINYKDGKTSAVLKTNLKDEKLIESYMELLKDDHLKASKQFSGIDYLKINTDKNNYIAPIIGPEELKKDLSILDINLKESEIIGYKEYLEIIEQLKRVPGIRVYPIARSYLGRIIYAIELMSKERGYISKTKRITNFPSEMINCRHHANEVSSTNAAFILLKKLLREEKYEKLTEKLNLVIVPLENVDGAEIHYELQKDNPNWKLHAARFNGVGKEFYYEHFKLDTIYTEAMALTRLWEKWLPDIIVDNHGVPSHEWDQQFSGYTSPSYKGFWLPRSLLYGYFWLVSNEEYKGNYIVNKKIEEVIADKIAENDEMTMWNKEWMSIFEKYAHEWMPKLFPADYYNDMINYWISFKFDPLHRYPSIRYPWITSVAYTSEVADETAQGDYLNLCARTHVAHDEAVIEMLMGSTSLFENQFQIEDDKISIKYIRHRPLFIK